VQSPTRSGRVRRPAKRRPNKANRYLIAAAALLALLSMTWFGYAQATRDPVVRTVTLIEPGWPADAPPVRLLLMSDTHVQGPDMPPARLARIVARANQLEPDVVVLAGDYTSSSRVATRTYGFDEAIEPLRLLKAKVRKVAILGNHDRHDPGESKAALTRVGFTVLENDAIQLGRLAIGSVHWGLKPALKQLRARQGTKILVAHSPDPFAKLPADIPLMLAGHTHCGQIVLPLIGALSTGSRYGSLYMCGVSRRPENMLVVTAGVGTSRMPLRFGAPPDIWLITIAPPPAAIAAAH
jgi:predicted MPP superfamily phosphohydrolase